VPRTLDAKPLDELDTSISLRTASAVRSTSSSAATPEAKQPSIGTSPMIMA